MKLNESLDKPFDWQWTTIAEYENEAMFWTDSGINYLVMFNKWGGKLNDDDSWEAEFSVDKRKTKDKALRKLRGKALQGITGTGDQQRVFATVIAIIKKFVKSTKPDIMYFTADEPSRRKLYSALTKKLASGLGYKIDTNKDGNYTLVRK